jgi:YfiH family protein
VLSEPVESSFGRPESIPEPREPLAGRGADSLTQQGAASSAPTALSTQHSPEGVPFLTFTALAALPGLVHGISTRSGGLSEGPYASLNLSLMVGDARERVLENRARLARAVGGDPAAVYSCNQVHGAELRVVELATTPAAVERERLDILLSGAPGRLLLLKFADCTPLLLYDPHRRWVALAHAGWRGTALNVAGTTVAALAARAGSDPADLWAGIGPAIGACCYEVGDEVISAVEAAVPRSTGLTRPGRGERRHLDLALANRQQLLAAGLRAERIVGAGRCTACERDTFFSHRAQGMPAGRFAVVAGVA